MKKSKKINCITKKDMNPSNSTDVINALRELFDDYQFLIDFDSFQYFKGMSVMDIAIQNEHIDPQAMSSLELAQIRYAYIQNNFFDVSTGTLRIL